ncbi:MAG: hypothetical protein QOF36_2584 [Microbacteriaceae bacterium]|jgi:hypothetical protein|nr:hypothetical protein [Microbacteriaceae bacterium]
MAETIFERASRRAKGRGLGGGNAVRSRPGDDTRPGHVWVCHHCAFTTTDVQEALEHPYAEPGNFTHWLHEHPLGNRGMPAVREIHSSDVGGCYLSPIPAASASDDARRWRDRASAGGVF